MSKQKVVMSVRLEPEYVEALSKVANMRGITKVQLLREFAANAESLYDFLQSEMAKQKSEVVKFRIDLSQWVIDNMPNDMGADLLEFVSNVMNHAAQLKRNQESGDTEAKEQR